MVIDSYTCELCLRQREETLRHLFLRCSFAKNCWISNWCDSTSVAHTREDDKIHKESTRGIICNRDYNSHVLVYMERKECMDFNNEDPSIDHYMIMFKKEFALVIQGVKERDWSMI
jgi:hypothetical protein